MTKHSPISDKKYWDDYEIQKPDGSWTTVSNLLDVVGEEVRKETAQEILKTFDEYEFDCEHFATDGDTKNRSFFDMSDSEKKEIMEKAADDANKAQRALMGGDTKKSQVHQNTPVTGFSGVSEHTNGDTKECICYINHYGKLGVGIENRLDCPIHGTPPVSSDDKELSSIPGWLPSSGEGWEEEFENILISIFGRRNEEGFFEIHAGTHYKGVNNIKAFIKSELSKQKEQIRKKVEALKPTLGDVHTWEKNKILDSVSKLLSEE